MADELTDSILDKTKLMLNIEPEDTDFDVVIIAHINSVFADMVVLGVGPTLGFAIEDKVAQWSEYTDDKLHLNQVRSYMYSRVRLLFDPPTTSFAIDAIQKQIDKYEFYFTLYAPKNDYTDTVITAEDGRLWDLTGGKDFPARAPLGSRGIDLDTGEKFQKV
jgi:hypothetical protein